MITEHLVINNQEITNGSKIDIFKFSYTKQNGLICEKYPETLIQIDNGLLCFNIGSKHSVEYLNAITTAKTQINSPMYCTDLSMFEEFKKVKIEILEGKIEDLDSKISELRKQMSYIKELQLDI